MPGDENKMEPWTTDQESCEGKIVMVQEATEECEHPKSKRGKYVVLFTSQKLDEAH